MAIKNGDMPAMPLPLGNDTTAGCDGLTKREMMAMHMMAAMQSLEGRHDHQYEAIMSVNAADALLAELERTK